MEFVGRTSEELYESYLMFLGALQAVQNDIEAIEKELLRRYAQEIGDAAQNSGE